MKKKQVLFIGLAVLVAIILAAIYVSWGNQRSNFVIGGQKDVHGCLIPAGYSWCEGKQKCLRAWEESCYSADEEAIQTIFGLQTKRPLSEIEVTINIMEGKNARGSVYFGTKREGAGANFLAVKISDKWTVVFSGNGNPANCSELAEYKFSADMISDLCPVNQ